ncbi:hypothetical protein LAWASA_3786 [Lawsonibacter asaccharolyticus]|nr:hypothetical protein LAWASA_3786 [Lawsonibacter asaccharolyticus]
MEAKIRKLGTLYSGSEMIGSENSLAYSKDDHPRDLIIRDTVPGLEITWVEYDGLLMARYPVLCKISFDDLKFAGLIQGKQVQIDGVRYELRLLRGGLRDYPSSDDLWVREVRNVAEGIWRNADFRCWGYRSPAPGSYSFDGVLTALTDSDSPIWTAVLPTDTRTETIGWRPVLEPTTQVEKQLEGLKPGHWVAIWGGDSVVSGILKEINNYDLILHHSSVDGLEEQDKGVLAVPLPDGRVCVDKVAIVGVRTNPQDQRRRAT